MKVRARARREQGEAIIPMINVIFLLLIFLMLAGRP
ncbi:MAG: biopolymer transporter ExbD, partial [Alphaproteobacteria bacterium]